MAIRGRWALAALIALFCVAAALAAVRGDSVQYVGGTLSLPEHTAGHLDLSAAGEARFLADKGGLSFAIPYASIQSLEYGEKVGRRLGVALAVNPLFLFSHKRRHYITLTYRDGQGATQGAVLEVGKHDIRAVLAQFSQASHVAVEYQSKEAKAYAEK